MDAKRIEALFIGMFMSAQVFAAADLDIRGFSTAGFSVTDSDQIYLGSDKDGTFNESTLLGLNLKFSPNKNVPIKFFTQLVAQGSDDWSVGVEWGYISWALAHNFNITLGRERAPLFMISETYHVGQTYPWIRPPEEIYGDFNVPLDSLEKIALDYTVELDNWSFNTEIFIGDGTLEAPLAGISVSGEVNKTWGAIFTANSDNLELRFAAIGVNIDLYASEFIEKSPDIQASSDALGQAAMAATASLSTANALLNSLELAIAGGDNSPATANAYSAALLDQQQKIADLAAVNTVTQAATAQLAQINGIPVSGKTWYYFLGFNYEGDKLVALGEFGHRDMGDFPYQDSDAGFLTFGYKYDKLMPHLTYSWVSPSHADLVSISQETFILGAVYKVLPWASLKAELQHIRLTDVDDSAPENIGLQDATPVHLGGSGIPEKDINKLSLAVTMVF